MCRDKEKLNYFFFFFSIFTNFVVDNFSLG
jgi:hypothetical protein